MWISQCTTWRGEDVEHHLQIIELPWPRPDDFRDVPGPDLVGARAAECGGCAPGAGPGRAPNSRTWSRLHRSVHRRHRRQVDALVQQRSPHHRGALSAGSVAVEHLDQSGPLQHSLNAFGSTGRATGTLFSAPGSADGRSYCAGTPDNAHEARISQVFDQQGGFVPAAGHELSVSALSDIVSKSAIPFPMMSGRPRSWQVSWPWRRSAAQPHLLLAQLLQLGLLRRPLLLRGRTAPLRRGQLTGVALAGAAAGLLDSQVLHGAATRPCRHARRVTVLLDHPQLVGGGEGHAAWGRAGPRPRLKEDRG